MQNQIKYRARLGMTAVVSDPSNRWNSISTGIITELTQRGLRLVRDDKSSDFVKWDNVREIY